MCKKFFSLLGIRTRYIHVTNFDRNAETTAPDCSLLSKWNFSLLCPNIVTTSLCWIWKYVHLRRLYLFWKPVTILTRNSRQHTVRKPIYRTSQTATFEIREIWTWKVITCRFTKMRLLCYIILSAFLYWANVHRKIAVNFFNGYRKKILALWQHT